MSAAAELSGWLRVSTSSAAAATLVHLPGGDGAEGDDEHGEHRADDAQPPRLGDRRRAQPVHAPAKAVRRGAVSGGGGALIFGA
ncbi:hypothetical protein STENM36S_04875 [Streptomyces tendae]